MKEGIKLMKNINFAPFLEKDEKIKPIKDHEDYYVSSYGKIFSTKQGYIRQLKPFLDGKGNYRIIRLDYKKYLLHRIVAINFIPNPKNLPEVNHKDKNKQNCKVDNLEWCTRKENLYDSYKTMSPVRNCRYCKLYKNDILIDRFESILAAARYANKKYGASYSSLAKYLHWNEFFIYKI